MAGGGAAVTFSRREKNDCGGFFDDPKGSQVGKSPIGLSRRPFLECESLLPLSAAVAPRVVATRRRQVAVLQTSGGSSSFEPHRQ